MRSLQVLVVEDEPMNREIAEIILQSYGHQVTTCENGREALRLCLEEGRPFDLILMDVLMPELDGLEATRRLRADARTREVPIICVSAKASGSDQGAGLAAGCDLYLSKPYKRHELLEAVDTVLCARGVPGWTAQQGESAPHESL